MAKRENPKNLAELKTALDRGDYKDNYVEIRVDNDSIDAQVFESPDPFASDRDDPDEDPDPMFHLRLGRSPDVVLVEALQLLGFKNADRV